MPNWLDKFIEEKQKNFGRWGLNAADSYEILRIFSEYFNAHDRNYYKLPSACKWKFLPPSMESLMVACICYYMIQKYGFYHIYYGEGQIPSKRKKWHRKGIYFYLKKLHEFYGTKYVPDAKKIINSTLKEELTQKERDFLVELYNIYPTFRSPRKKIAALILKYFPGRFRTVDLLRKFYFTMNNRSKIYMIRKDLNRYEKAHIEKFKKVYKKYEYKNENSE